jgi:biotin carboxyl carrier protein
MRIMRRIPCRINRDKQESESLIVERRFRITVNGNRYDVTVEELTEDSSRILPQPGDMRVPEQQSYRTAIPETPSTSGVMDAAPNDLVSPLAGVVESLTVKQGDRIAQGGQVAVIEAMKMKTTVVAHRDGIVSHIAVEEGDAVDAGQAIMTIE